MFKYCNQDNNYQETSHIFSHFGEKLRGAVLPPLPLHTYLLTYNLPTTYQHKTENLPAYNLPAYNLHTNLQHFFGVLGLVYFYQLMKIEIPALLGLNKLKSK